MAFIESPRFPDELAYGALGGPRFSTSVIADIGGFEQRNQNWSADLGEWEIGMVNRQTSMTLTLLAYFRAVAKGRLNGFRFHDFGAGEDTCTDEPVGTGDGVKTTFQLIKRYAQGSYSYNRLISKPVTGTTTVKLNGTPTVLFTIDTTTGIITMNSPPAGGVLVTASATFDVPVRFDTDWLNIRKVDADAYSWESIKLYEVRDIT